MLGQLIVYPLFCLLCVAGVVRPWIGLVGFYGWVILEPQWNWRWSISQDFQFQKYIAIATLAGWLLSGAKVPHLSRGALVGIYCLVAFLILGFISQAQSIDPELSSFYMSNMWKIVMMAVLAILLIDRPEKVWIALIVCSVAQGYSAFRINEQYFQDGYCLYAYRPWGTKGDNNLYSNLTVPLIACSIAVAIYSKKNLIRYGCGFIAILQIHQIMLLQSRGAMLASMMMALIIVWAMPKNRFTIRSTIFCIIATIFLAGPSVVKEFSSSFESDGNRDASADSRFYLWKAGAAITQDYPLLGVGPYAGQRLVPSYYEGELDTTRKGLHNLAFEISTGFGIPATVLYFAFFMIPWFSVWSLRSKLGNMNNAQDWSGAACVAVLAGIPGYLVGSMFSSGALSESSYCLAAIGLATVSVAKKRPSTVAPLSNPGQSVDVQ
ncbi:O-Antigen ligase [Stieleria bergensis]|uniref:O-Antigen ligase n=1 Tax=Stieleria bergensis TaxID=2528025 RepID=A0A517SXY6_9BACT|nr:O-Antigen ligase [Planctomycetes bacterium SV_7m_r]